MSLWPDIRTDGALREPACAPSPAGAGDGIRVAGLATAHDRDPAHSEQDARLAIRLFDELRDLHRLEARDRALLAAAARLHDIGVSESPDGSAHHKRGCRMILKTGLRGCTAEETRIVASVVRYHRRALPRPSHGCMEGLSDDARSRVARMAALLRIADGLDRTHRGAIRDLSCRVEDGTLVLLLRPLLPPGAEIAAARKKGDLFRKVFGMEVDFRTEAC
jgi:exopolyphosphatase / guanosine-5'-triphosphate,3'-diphosphate pyrophosphatase